MAEGRMLKRSISDSKRLPELKTDSARLLWTWILPYLDVEGRYYADPDIIKGKIVPRLKTFTVKKVAEYLEDMNRVGLIEIYTVDNERFLQFRRFDDHQLGLRKDREAPSKIPNPIKRRSLPVEIWKSLWDDFKNSNHSCPICLRVGQKKGETYLIDGYIPFEIDHKIPLNSGGSDEKSNLYIVCRTCNRSKGSRLTPEELQSDDGLTPEFGAPTPAQEKLNKEKLKEANSDTPSIDNPQNELMASLKTILEKTKERYPDQRDQQKILVFVQANLRNKNHDAILHCIESLIKNKGEVKAIPQYLEAALKIENGKFNAAEMEKKNNEFKRSEIPEQVGKIIKGIGKDMPAAH